MRSQTGQLDSPGAKSGPGSAGSSTIRLAGDPGTATGSGRRRLVVATCCAALVPTILYFVFVARYGVNFIYLDEWNNVSMFHAAIHDNLTWSMLWAQHNENRMLFPNLVFILFALNGHFDTKSIMYLSAALFSVTYVLFLALYRIYAGRWLGPLLTLFVGCLWFSLADFENALWGFQFAWYLVVFCVMAMCLCLSWRSVTITGVGAAAGFAIVASYSSLQGLILWAVGLLVLMWRIRDRRKAIRVCGAWVAAGIITTALYLDGFNTQPSATGGGSVSFAVHHPVGTIKYFFAAVGNVIPGHVGLPPHELLGLALTLVAIYVFVRCCKEDPEVRSTPLPAALILFAMLFDLSVALGRVSFGIDQALSSRYTMANLLLLLGVASYLLPRLPTANLPDRRIIERRWSHVAIAGVAVLFLLAQLLASTEFGIENALIHERTMTTGARVVVNLDRIPASQQSPLVETYVYPSIQIVDPLIRDAESDRLGMFAPGTRQQFAREGPPG